MTSKQKADGHSSTGELVQRAEDGGSTRQTSLRSLQELAGGKKGRGGKEKRRRWGERERGEMDEEGDLSPGGCGRGKRKG